jgi:hypothetical protein
MQAVLFNDVRVQQLKIFLGQKLAGEKERPGDSVGAASALAGTLATTAAA